MTCMLSLVLLPKELHFHWSYSERYADCWRWRYTVPFATHSAEDGWFCSEVSWLIFFMYFPVEECNAVNFPLPGSDCVGWEDRNIQGLRISFYTVIQEKFDLPGFSPTFCTRWNKGNKLAQNSSALMYMLKKSYKKINTTIYMVTNKWLVILIQFLLQNKERAEFLSRIAFYCFLGSNTCTTIIEVWLFPIVLFWVFVWLSGFRHVIVSVHWNNSCLIV